MIEIQSSDLVSNTEVRNSAIVTKLLGTAESSSVPDLDEFLRRLHHEAIESKVGEVVVDLRALEFMNSSCFKMFVSWIGQLQDMPADVQYRVRFVADEKKHWQNRSLGALACFAVDLIRVEMS